MILVFWLLVGFVFGMFAGSFLAVKFLEWLLP